MHVRGHHFLIPVQALLSLLLFATQLQGQVDSAGKVSPLAQGSWAIQFGVASNFTLTSFTGSILSIKYHLSETRAIRVGISGELSTYKTETFDVERYESNRQNFQVTSSYLFYSNVQRDVFLFWGLGPVVSFDRTYDKRPTASYSDYNVIRTTEYPRWGVGVAGALGVEWFASSWLSIHAEYGGSAIYSWGKLTESSEQLATSPSLPSYYSQYETLDKSWKIRSSNVWFGASVYL